MKTIDDIDDALFTNPIDLLQIIEQLNRIEKSKDVIIESLVEHTDSKGQVRFGFMSGLCQKYDVSEEELLFELSNQNIKPFRRIDVFPSLDIEKILMSIKDSDYIFNYYLRQIKRMNVNFSYKPLLLYALFSSPDGKLSVKELCSFFFDFYDSRKMQGLIIEQPSSTFVKHYRDVNKAIQSIMRYPILILYKAALISFDFEKEVASFDKRIWDKLSKSQIAELKNACSERLSEYYRCLGE